MLTDGNVMQEVGEMDAWTCCAALGVGVAVMTTMMTLRSGADANPDDDDTPGDRSGESQEQENPVPSATGRQDTHDPLGTEHGLPASKSKYVCSEQSLVNGKNTSAEREDMFQDTEDTGEAGSMGHPSGQEDRNPIGKRKG